MWYVYIIYSESCDVYYKGESEKPLIRLEAHNNGLSEFTKGKGPWKLVYVEQFENRSEALKREKQIKRFNNRSLQKLINSDSNIISHFSS